MLLDMPSTWQVSVEQKALFCPLWNLCLVMQKIRESEKWDESGRNGDEEEAK
jgi:hypothetical protein